MMREIMCPLACLSPLDDLNTFGTGLYCKYFLTEATE